MAKTTGIAWARSTRNLWAGCTKIGPGCDGCYAESFQRWVQGKDPESGEAKNWGPGRPRIPYLLGAFKDLRSWNRQAAIEAAENVPWRGRPGYWPVFLNTQSDFFDNEAPQEWRDAAYPVIEQCSDLTLFLVTKRVGNVAVMVPKRWMENGFPPHVRLLVTVVNNKEAARDIPKLLELPCKNGISYEPALELVDWREIDLGNRVALDGLTGLHSGYSGPGTIEQCLATMPPLPGAYKRGVEWIIAGGESDQAGHKARPFDLEWARATIAAGRDAGVPVFVKQLGSYCVGDVNDIRNPPIQGNTPMVVYEDGAIARFRFNDDSGSDPAEWPADLCVQEFPL